MLLLGIGLLWGCSTANVHSRAFERGARNLDLASGSACFFTIHTENQYNPAWPAEVYAISVVSDADKKEYTLNMLDEPGGSLLAQATRKALKDVFTPSKSGPFESLASIQLPPGSYRLTSVRGGCAKGIGVAAMMGSFDFPFNLPFQVGSEEIVYLGRIEMTNRKRTSNEEISSGGKLGLVGQSASGFGEGTFDIKIYDNLEQDILKYKNQYPILSNAKIIKRILPPWEKPKSNP
jgi:hypothetical protein